MDRISYILFLFSVVSGNVLRNDHSSSPPEILIETNPTTDFASLPKPLKMEPLILQQGTNVIYKPQFILSAMNIPLLLANSDDKEDCRTKESPEIAIVVNEEGYSKELETPAKVLPSYISADPIISKVPDLVSEAIKVQPMSEIPAAPTLPPFTMPELPEVEEIQDPPNIPVICQEELILPEQPMQLLPSAESESLVTQPAPTLSPFSMPELPNTEIAQEPKTSAPAKQEEIPELYPKQREILLVIEEPVSKVNPPEIPAAPTLSPFVMPDLPEIEILPETPCQYKMLMQEKEIQNIPVVLDEIPNPEHLTAPTIPIIQIHEYVKPIMTRCCFETNI